jgi:phytoene dehydrogenase-like protein
LALASLRLSEIRSGHRRRSISGGLATAGKKGGFTFENCIHWLVASKDGGQLNAGWKEVFDIGRLEFFEDPAFQVFEHGADRITIYRDPDRLEAELLAKAPQDAAAVKEFVGLIRQFAKLRMPEGDTFFQNIGTGSGRSTRPTSPSRPTSKSRSASTRTSAASRGP